MSLKTRYNLYRAQKSLNASRNFKADLWKKLGAAWDARYQVTYVWYQTVWFKQAVGFAAVILIIGNLSTVAYAYSSPTVNKSSVLYPIKEQLENLEEKVRATPEAKAKFYLKKIERREEEFAVIKKVVEKKETVKIENKTPNKREKKIEIIIDKQIELAEKKLEATQKDLEKIKSADNELKTKVKERLEKRLEKRKERLEQRLDKIEKKPAESLWK